MLEESGYWIRQRYSRRRVLRGAGLAGAGLATAALIGCGEDEEAASDPTSAAPSGTAAGTSAGGEQVSSGKPGGRLQMPLRNDPPTFDMHGSSTGDTARSTSPAYNQLLQFDPHADGETPETIIADLASEWEVSPDGQTYTFHLVQNAKFHNGAPFTAADAKASYERQINPPEDLAAAPRGAQLAPIGSIETPDDYTLVMKMSRPVSSLSAMPILAQGWMSIYSKADIDAGIDGAGKPNGTGPFIFKEYQPGAKIVYDKNPDYFVADRPYFDGIDIFIIPDTSTRLAQFQGGGLHVFGEQLGVKDAEQLQASLGDKVVLYRSPGAGLGWDSLNYAPRAPWNDLRVRQAIGMAMDHQAHIEIIRQGAGVLTGYMPPPPSGYWGLTEQELQQIPGYAPFSEANLTEARKLLDAAGVAAEIEVRLLTRQGPTFEPVSLYVQDQIARVGIKATLDVQETASAYERLDKREFDLVPWTQGIALDDPDAIFAESFLDGAPRNYSEVSTPEIEDLFVQQSAEQDPEKRRELVKQLQTVAMTAYGKYIMSAASGSPAMWWAAVKGIGRSGQGYNNSRWQDVWLDI